MMSAESLKGQLLAHSIIQILTGTVMKYHVSVDCQESYIFPKDYILLYFIKYCPEGIYNDLGTTGT